MKTSKILKKTNDNLKEEDGKCHLCKSRERQVKNNTEYCGGCGNITKLHYKK